MGKLHLGSITELADRICRYNDIIDKLKLSNDDLKERVTIIENEQFEIITEEAFDALPEDKKAAKNYAIIEQE